MKKTLIMTFMFCAFYAMAASAAVKNGRDVMLDFTLSYKPDKTSLVHEHVMKNSVKLNDNKWVVAGKLQTGKNNHFLLLLARMLSHKNNKFNLQFMLVNSEDEKTFITEPRIATMIGLPVQLVQTQDDKSIQLNALVKIVGSGSDHALTRS